MQNEPEDCWDPYITQGTDLTQLSKNKRPWFVCKLVSYFKSQQFERIASQLIDLC